MSQKARKTGNDSCLVEIQLRILQWSISPALLGLRVDGLREPRKYCLDNTNEGLKSNWKPVAQNLVRSGNSELCVAQSGFKRELMHVFKSLKSPRSTIGQLKRMT